MEKKAVLLSLVSLFTDTSTFVGYLMPNPSFEKNSSSEYKEDLHPSEKYLCEGERNIVTRDRTGLLRFRSPSL